MTDCLLCHQHPRSSRGLCTHCYYREKCAGRIESWPLRRPLGDPGDADDLVIERALRSEVPRRERAGFHVTDPADRARIVQLVADGKITRTRATRLLHCSGATIVKYLRDLASTRQAA